MHDITQIEGRGLPGVFVASSAFVQAADSQSQALGYHPAAVFVDHPIQDRTDKEVQALAQGAADEIIKALFGETGQA